jgi:hypothetical protein
LDAAARARGEIVIAGVQKPAHQRSFVPAISTSVC